MLMYHAILPGDQTPDWPWALSLRQFRSQLDFLAEAGYATPTLSDFVADPMRFTGRTAIITFDDGYSDNRVASQELQQRNMAATWFIVTGSIGQSPAWADSGRPPGRLLNDAELRAMQAAGMEIGSHTIDHVRLTEVDDAQLAHQLAGSRARLEDCLGSAVKSFAYPYGVWDARCAAAVAHAGYTAACTTRSGRALHNCDPYTLRRLTVFNHDTTSSLMRKLALGGNEVGWPTIARLAMQRVFPRTNTGN
jgi:peptidoglycan/xylan/chitin deacetylase (PgdA/CDA1 family)